MCLPGARIEHVTERVEKIMGRGKGGSLLVHIGTNNADKEGTTSGVLTTGPLGPGPQAPELQGAPKFSTNIFFRA